MSRLSEHTIPVRYDLALRVDPRADRFSGRVSIEIHAPAGSRKLALHAVDLDIETVAVRDARGEIEVREVRHQPKRETVEIRLARAISGRDVHLSIGYGARLRSDLRGLYLARSGERRYAATQLEAADARRFFPCFDEPDKKARFELRVTTPTGNEVISNAPVRRVRRKGAEKTVEFEETPRLSTYLIALVVGELEGSRARYCGPTPIRVWAVPGRRKQMGFALEAAAEALVRLERYFGLPYPYGKLDLIAVPDFEFGAMENAGAVTFRESLLLSDPRKITLPEKKRIAEVVAHELAHMWFGDLVTMAWWDDLWLNEAFATWMAFTIVDDWKPEWHMWLDFEQHRAGAYALDALVNTHPIYTDVRTPDEATENFDRITYEKGASVVRMIESYVGAARFRRGVRRYIREHREGNARGDDLWQALSWAAGERLGPIVRRWIEQPGFPLVEVETRARGGSAHLHFRQERYFADARRGSGRAANTDRAAKSATRRHGKPDRDEALWPIPAVIALRTARARSEKATLIRRRTGKLDLGAARGLRFVYANANETGFYRPIHSQALLAQMLEHFDALETVERMGLAAHQWAGVEADRAPLSSFLDVVCAARDERSPEVLAAVAAPLAFMKDQLLPGLDAASARRFADFVSATFQPSLDALGWKVRRADGPALALARAELIRLVGGIAEDGAVLAQIESRIDAYLARRSAIDVNLANILVTLAARTGDKSRYDAYLAVVRRAETPQERQRFELALAAFRDPALVARTLELSLTPEIPTQDVVPVLCRLLQNPEARAATWAFVQERWSELFPRISTGLASRLVSALPALQTTRHKREVAAFFKAHPIPSAARALKQTLEQFTIDAALRIRTAPALRAWLRTRFAGAEDR